MATNLKVIDLGSNSVRLRITKILDSGQTELIRYEKEYVRLSENMGPERLLKKEPMERTLKALKNFKAIYEQFDGEIIAVATAAVRQATNQREFLQRVKDEVGLKIKVISGKREAYLDYLGVSRTLPLENGIIIDTGGASMELILVDQGQAEETVSLPIGSVLLSQQYNLADQVSAVDLYEAIIKVDEVLSSQRWLNRARHTRVVALGGSNRALAKMYRWRLAAGEGVPMPVHGLTMQTVDAYEMMEELLRMNREQRGKVRGISAARADVIIGGLLPIMALLRQLSMNQVMFSSNGLREGLLFEYIDQKFGGFRTDRA
jgi:exopolyphosphatase / guanosine-5'-triphosphate,3'-diphosphate pyrophosphatase